MSTAKSAPATKAEQTETTTLKVVKILPENPIALRLRKIHEVQSYTEKRTKLISAQDDLRDFEKDMNAETDRITLSTDAGGNVTIRKPDAVKKVVAILNEDLQNAISEIENLLLQATI